MEPTKKKKKTPQKRNEKVTTNLDYRSLNALLMEELQAANASAQLENMSNEIKPPILELDR